MLIHNPICQGHVLVCPKANISKFRDMEVKEVFEFSLAIKLVTETLQRTFKEKAEAFTISIQEGQGAGQTINHLHAHIIPRHHTEKFRDEDDIYKELEDFDK